MDELSITESPAHGPVNYLPTWMMERYVNTCSKNDVIVIVAIKFTQHQDEKFSNYIKVKINMKRDYNVPRM